MKPGKCSDRIERIRDVEKEYQVAIIAQGVLDAELEKNPSTLRRKGLARSDFDNFTNNLGTTYLIRIFAEFESGLRQYWRSISKKKTRPQVSDLIKSISSRRRIDYQEIEDVENVQNYRNKLIHDEQKGAQPVSIKEARQSLCTFFRRLPEDW